MAVAYVTVIISALIVAALTFFSGFGLGTLLMPVFALFFPLEAAIAATAIVHLANNLFKVLLVGRWADVSVVIRFAIPAAVAAVIGALALNSLSGVEPIHEYSVGGRVASITPLKLVLAALIFGFALFETLPVFSKLAFGRKHLILGGVLSGFFGGLSGHQGALRSAFLVRLGLTKEQFLGTVVISAVVVDCSRLLVYGVTMFSSLFEEMQGEGRMGLVATATLAAFVGTYFGKRLLEKVTITFINRAVAVLLFLLAIALGAGLV